MPGPGARNAKKRKPPTPASRAQASNSPSTAAIPENFFADIDNGATWQATVDHLCEYFELPDLGTRHGLKKVHAKFDKIYKKLEEAYAGAQSRKLERLMGGIVGIWAKMCADSILRDKLFDAGVLSKIMAVLEYDSTRHIGLNALSLVTHHGGDKARCEIARKNPILLELIRAHPEDRKVLELATATISHASNAVLAVEDAPDANLVKAIRVRPTLKATIENIQKPIASYYMIDHAFGLFTSATRHCPVDCKAVPSMLTLLVACLRSTDITSRSNALGGLIRLVAEESEQDQLHFDPYRIMGAVQRGFPPHLSDLLMDYGPHRCDTTLTLKTSADYQRAMMRTAQDRNFVSLGRTLAELIERTEFSISEGTFQVEGRGGRMETMDLGLPFKMWTDALPHCAKALRARGTAADLDTADVLELKFLIIRQRIPEVVALGHRATARNPDLAYAYYAISMGADREAGLRAVKKGLKCSRVTPFVKTYMLWRAVEHAGDLGMKTLYDARVDGEDAHHAQGVAFLMSAWEDAKTFTSEAPPDNRHMLTILSWYIILTLAIKGPELSADLKELDAAKRKLDISVQFMKTLGFAIRRTQIRVAREFILNLYPKAVEEWGDFIKHVDELNEHGDAHKTLPSSLQADDDLSAWLENMRLDEDEDDHKSHPSQCTSRKIRMNNVELYRCSWCGNPSAVLKKCTGCGNARYCDSQCQKRHWSNHKLDCKK